MRSQVLLIHGGNVFNSYDDYLEFLRSFKPEKFEDLVRGKDWKSNLADDLGDDFEVIQPRMPCGNNAKYLEWKIWFEKFLPFLRDGIILVGHSLGGSFLLKYLTENKFPVRISQLHLVAAAVSETEEPLDGFLFSKDLGNVSRQAEKIYLYHSKDDPVVPFSDCEELAKRLPEAEKVIFANRKHFYGENFPELVARIKAKS